MRMRKRHNLEPRLEKCAGVIAAAPEENKGRWLQGFPDLKSLHIEIGCGKGRFTAETAKAEPGVLLVALEKIADAMVIASERICRDGSENVRFIIGDAKDLKEMFADGEAERIYINFCDPWPKSRDAKFRLTFPGFLRLYADILTVGGEIHFKTDNTPLFDWSLEQFKAEGWELKEVTHDLHKNGPVGIMTDYEAKFYAEGMKINRLAAVKTAATKTTAAGPVARFHDAALTDARGFAESKKAHEGDKNE